jgi:hypothetical protein
MQKYFTKELTQPLKVIFLGLVLGAGISFAAADWTAPPAAAPTCPASTLGCNAPINVGSTSQKKSGKITLGTGTLDAATDNYSASFNKGTSNAGIEADGIVNVAGLFNLGGALFGFPGAPAADVAIYGSLTENGPTTVNGTTTLDASSLGSGNGGIGSRALVLKSNANTGTAWANSVTIASPTAANLTIYDDTRQQPMSLRAQDGKFNGQIGVGAAYNTSQAPVWRSGGIDVDLSGRPGSSGSDGMSFNVASGVDHVGLVAKNTSTFNFWSDVLGNNAKIVAGAIQLTNGNPVAGQVLTATDSSGNAAWLPSNTPTMQYIEVDAPAQVTTASAHCPAGYVLTGGGGSCDNAGGANYPTQRSSFNGSEHNQWDVACAGNGANPAAHAYAVCQSIPNYVAPIVWSLNTTPLIMSGTNGFYGQSCQQWSGKPSNKLKSRTTTNNGASYQETVGQCAYMSGSGACVNHASNYSNASESPASWCQDGATASATFSTN